MAGKKQIEGQMSFADFLTGQAGVGPAPKQPENDTAHAQPDTAHAMKQEPAKVQEQQMSEEDARFEEEFAKLTELFARVRTDDFDAMQYLVPIANAVKTSIAEEISFAEALEGHCAKRSAEKILAAFDPKKQAELISLIGGMHDEI
ncbi:MAG: hypothetical protein J5518_03555 [Lachnospiraceae bacterium]|nr:hypothetical protein [Lachnospiraceae bacterium]